VAEVHCQFAGKNLHVRFINKKILDFQTYKIQEVLLNKKNIILKNLNSKEILLDRKLIESEKGVVEIEIILDE
jgi:hypothetical protein